MLEYTVDLAQLDIDGRCKCQGDITYGMVWVGSDIQCTPSQKKLH